MTLKVLRATRLAIAAADLTAADQGAVQALLVLAEKIDRDPTLTDNVSIPTYLKYCESLGLTPAGRVRLGEKKETAAGGKLTSLQGGVRRPA